MPNLQKLHNNADDYHRITILGPKMKKNNDMLNKYFEDANNEMLDLNIYLHQQEVNSNTFCFSLWNGQVLYFTPYGFVKCFLYFQMDGYHFYLTT